MTFDDLHPFKASNKTSSSILKLPERLMNRMNIKPLGRMSLALIFLNYGKNIDKFLKAQALEDRSR